MLIAMNEDGVFEEYDDTHDIIIHCESAEEHLAVIEKMKRSCWITDRDPTPEEVEQAGDVGFIICISGKLGTCVYQHATDMQDNFFEDGRWYLHGGLPNKTSGLQGDEYEMYKVHGWMLPPVWED